MAEPQEQEHADGAVPDAPHLAAMGARPEPGDAAQEDALGEDAVDEGPPSERPDAAG